jgi:hypothetical protein
LPLKIKIFLWHLNLGVILTKDNLLKRKWKGNSDCCFCSSKESIQHLFFDCYLARLCWNLVQISFGLTPPTNVSDLFGNWLNGFHRKLRNQIMIGAAALCWALWLNRNEVVFIRTSANNSLQVIFRTTHWIRTWSKLSKEEEIDLLKSCCCKLDVAVMEVFSKFGWCSNRRLGS